MANTKVTLPNLRRLLFAALPLFCAFTSLKALADSSAVGVPTQIISLNNSSDFSTLYKGTILLNGAYYYWGGSFCSPYTYESSDIPILSEAVSNKKNITIFYKRSNAGASCLTGIILNGNGTTAANSIPKIRP